MKCENCGNNEVTFVYRSNINGKITEKHLCSKCAAEQGYTRSLAESHERLMRGFFGEDFFGRSMLDGFMRPRMGFHALGEELFDDFFREMPALTGEMPQEPVAAEKEKLLVEEKEQGRFARMRKLNALRLEMKKAVRREDFEQAAKLRDEIRALEQEHKESA